MMLFWQHGYEGASLSMLTSRMGINATSLYAAFGSKFDLFRESMELYAKGDAINARATEDTGTIRDAIAARLRATVKRIRKRGCPPGCMSILGDLNCAPENASVSLLLRRYRESVYEYLKQTLRRGVGAGELRSDTDIDRLAGYLMTVISGLSLRARDGATKSELEASVEHALIALDSFITARDRND
jgi:AcrR family transcriptional regulator